MASYKFRGNGKVQITITRGKRYDGKPNRYRREVNYVSDKQLEEEAALFLADIIGGRVTASDSSSIDQLYNDFIRNNGGINAELKTSTAKRYKILYNNQIKGKLGHRKISKVTKIDIRDWVKDLSENGKNKRTNKPLAPKTVKNALSLLSSMYNYARDDLEIVEKNPCDHVKVPKASKKYKIQKDFYNERELIDLITLLHHEMEDDRCITHATIVLLILFTGIRAGEAMGLRWEDINMDNKTMQIRRERLCVHEIGVIEDTPKTNESIRDISIPSHVVDMLKSLRAYQGRCGATMGDEYHDSGYVATTVTGSPQHPNNTYRWYKRFLKRYNLKDATLHDLRHTHVAMLSSMGVKIIDVSKRLGHTNTRITQEVYEYLFKNVDDTISNQLDDYLSKLKM